MECSIYTKEEEAEVFPRLPLSEVNEDARDASSYG